MHGRTKSVPALESYDGNWVIGTSLRTDQTIYSVPRSVELKKLRNGEYEHNLHSTRERNNGEGGRSNIIKENRTGGYHANQTTRRIKNRYNRHRSADRLDEHSLSTTDGHHSRSLALSRESAFEGHQRRPRQVVLRKSDGDFGFTMRQISSALYGRRSEASFVPTPGVPALQRLNIVEPGSLAYRAGLRPEDFILEINGEYVARSSHLHVVQLIKNSGKTLTIKVIEGAEENENEGKQHSIASSRSHHRVRYADKIDLNNNNVSQSRDWENGKETLRRGRHRTTVETGSSNPPSSQGFSQPNPAGSAGTTSRTPQKPSSVANIRLSRMVANDQVYYVSNDRRDGRNGLPHPAAPSTLKTAAKERRLSPPPPPRMTSSSSSVASIKSHPTAHRKRYQKHLGATSSSTSGDVSRARHRDVIHEVQNEAAAVEEEEAVTGTGNDEDLQSVSELKLDDVAYTYDVIRPRDVPFETDEGYIGLNERVDYVTESTQDAEKINFLEMAERVRQLYLRSKSISQAQQ